MFHKFYLMGLDELQSGKGGKVFLCKGAFRRWYYNSCKNVIFGGLIEIFSKSWRDCCHTLKHRTCGHSHRRHCSHTRLHSKAHKLFESRIHH